MSAEKPDTSVVLVTTSGYPPLRQTMAALRAQTSAARLEIIIVAPAGHEVKVDALDAQTFAEVRIIAGRGRSVAAWRADGARAAAADVVAFAEDHCFPSSQWAEAMRQRHDEGCAVVGPVMQNANPGSAVSWASFLLAYGPWVAGEAGGGEVPSVAGHNGSYRRALLLEYGDELDQLMSAEYVIHQDLRQRGHIVYVEPRAVCNHVNLSRLRPFFVAAFHFARVFAACRARHWNLGRRALYTLGSPLIPLVRLRRMMPVARRHAHQRFLPVIAALGICAIASAVGEMAGYATGAGRSGEKDWEHELDRRKLLNDTDAPLLPALEGQRT